MFVIPPRGLRLRMRVPAIFGLSLSLLLLTPTLTRSVFRFTSRSRNKFLVHLFLSSLASRVEEVLGDLLELLRIELLSGPESSEL